jgi:hypothetical protein
VLAGFERGDHVVVVQVGGRQDLDGVDGVVRQHVRQVGMVRRGAPFLGRLAADLLVGVAHADDVAAGVFEVAPHVHGRDVAGAQDAQPNLVHQTLPCRRRCLRVGSECAPVPGGGDLIVVITEH